MHSIITSDTSAHCLGQQSRKAWLAMSVAGIALCAPAVARAQPAEPQESGAPSLGTPQTQAPAAAASPVDTQPADAAVGGLEEIVVTAQRRAQNLQDVPIAVTAITEASIQANRITSVQDLSGFAPNVIVRPSAGGSAIPTFSMRGLTSYGVVPGSDKQVSINLDGVYISATRGALFEFPDIARIEVLRGPQGTLFGRNATAGAVSITTKDPDGQFGGRLEGGIGNYDQRRVRVSLDSPQIGPFSAYISFVHNERNGDIRNLGAGTRWDRTGVGTFNGKTYDTGTGVQYSPEYLGSKNVETYFGAVKFEPSDTFHAVYKYDLSVDHSTPEGVGVVGLNTDPISGTAAGAIVGAIFANQPAGGGPFGPAVLSTDRRPKEVNNFYTVPSYLKNQGHSLTSELRLADKLSVKNIAAYRKSYLRSAVSQIGGLGGLVVTNAAIAAAPAFFIPNLSAVPAIRALQIAGTQNALRGQRLVDVGTNIQNQSKQWSDETQFNYDSKFATITAGGIYFHSTDVSGPPQYLRGTASLAFFPATGEVPLGTTAAVSYNRATSIAGYAQGEFHITPQLDFVLGGRLTRDRKSGRFVSGISPKTGATIGTFTSTVAGCPVTSNPVGNCRTAGTYGGLSTTPFTYRDTRFIYNLGVNYKVADHILTYVKYSTGYVSGGAIGGIGFKPETVKAAEAGLKADFLDRRLRTNLAVFYAKYRNVQSAQSGRNVFDPVLNRFRNDLGTAVVTAFNERATGFEFEATAAPVDGVTLGGSLGYTDIKQSNYNTTVLTPALLVVGKETSVNFRPTGTPKWTGNLSAQYETPPLFGDVKLVARVDANYRSRLYHDANRDRATLLPQFAGVASSPPQWILNSRVALRDFRIGGVSAEIAAWGRNLTNNKDPLFPLVTPFEASTSYQAARTFGVDLILKF